LRSERLTPFLIVVQKAQDKIEREKEFCIVSGGDLLVDGTKVTCDLPSLRIVSKKDAAETQKRRNKTAERKVKWFIPGSIQATYTTNEGRLCMPPLTFSSCDTPPSASGCRERGGKVNAVEIQSASGNSWLRATEITIPTKDQEEHPLMSHLGSVIVEDDDRGKLECCSETDVQDRVRSVVTDVIRCLGCDKELQVFGEQSSLSKTRLVVKCRGHVLMSLVVKRPEIEVNQVFQSMYVAGQVYESLVGLRQQLGHEYPIVCMVTYSKLVIATLQDPSILDKHADHLEEVKKHLQQDTVPDKLQGEVEDWWQRKKQQRKKGRKKKQKTKLIDSGIENRQGQQDADTKEKIAGNVFYSNVYEEGEVFPALLQALLVSFFRCRDQPGVEI
jgi:hypothetical protein